MLRLTGSRRKVVLTVHLAAALSLLGASLVLVIGSLHAATRSEASEAHAVYTLLRLLTFSADIPLAMITLLSGLTLALTTTTWRILGDRWLTTKLALFLATVTVGIALLGPSLDTMLDVTESSDPGTSSTRWRLPLLAGIQAAMLISAATLGVFKPGRRARSPSTTKSAPRTTPRAAPPQP